MRAKLTDFTFLARVVLLGESPEAMSAICLHNFDLRRLLLHRIEVLEVALLELAELQSKAAEGTGRLQ
jgi:hypothetical protein